MNSTIWQTKGYIALAAAVSALGGCDQPPAPTNSVPLPVATTPPPKLSATGLWSDPSSRTLAADVLTYSPQYPLWTDGAAKQRWIALPAGTAIDARDIDVWQFPIGTRLWKEFAFDRPVETRFMLRTDAGWQYATYVWNQDGTDADLAPERGLPGVVPTRDGARHDIPGLVDCRLCHEGGRSPVLGFSALQLSPDRDPLAPHATPKSAGDVDLPALLARGLLAHVPERWQTSAPRIAARTPHERAAVGYLFGNCAGCHNADGPLQRLGLRFDHPLAASTAPALTTALDVASHFSRGDATHRLVTGDPEHSVIVRRLRATDPLTQMPPFGRHVADTAAVALFEHWLGSELPGLPVASTQTTQPRTH
ncbi:MAG: hypothetical protein IPK26_13440 [Planctomycetes bacterium]|nr:hypothetical protein [Planctomycetota bacterium]